MPKRKADPTKAEDFEGLIKEFQNESDRAAIVVGGAYLDVKLAEYIANFLIDDTDEVNKLLGLDRSKVGYETPLGAFSARIRAAYCLGLLTHEQYRDLLTIQKIRNEFAHGLHGLSFADERITSQCRNLLVPKQELSADSYKYYSPRDLFLLTLTDLVADFATAKFFVTSKQDRCVVRKNKEDMRFRGEPPDRSRQ